MTRSNPTEDLHEAIRNDDLGALALAIADGGDLQALSRDGWSPLHIAALNASDRRIPARLCDLGCSIDAFDSQGRTPEQLAVQTGNRIMAIVLKDLRQKFTDRLR